MDYSLTVVTHSRGCSLSNIAIYASQMIISQKKMQDIKWLL